MANYLSQPYEVLQPTSNINVNLTQQVLALKQGTYDFNKSKIQQTLDSFSQEQLDLLRPEDQAYAANKITQLTNQLNKSGSRDLSQGFIADDILNTVRGVANDPIVLNAIENTQKYRNFQSQVQKIQEKNPELYSDTNYSYALNQGGFEDYMAGNTDKIGNLQYSNFVDVTSTALKKVKELKDLRGKQVIETPDPQNPGQTIKRSIEGLTDQEIFQYIPNLLSSQENQQLTINGWSKYGGNLELAKSNLDSYKTETVSNIDENIENARAIINNSAVSSEDKKRAQAKLASYEKQKEQFITEVDSIDVNNAAAIGGVLERNSWKAALATMAKSEWSQELEKDEYYFAKAGLELDMAQEERDIQKFELDSLNTSLDIAKKQQELGMNPDGTTDINAVTYSAKEGELIQEINPFNDQLKEFGAVTNEMTGIISSAINSERTPDDVKDLYVSELKKRGYDANGNVIQGKEQIAAKFPKSLAMKQAFDASNAGTIHYDAAKTLAGIEVKRNALASEVDKVKVDGLTEAFSADPDRYISSAKSNLEEALTDSQSDLSEDTAIQLEGLASEVNTFVNQNGGWNNLKKALQNDKAKLKQFAEISDKLANKPMTAGGWTSRFIGAIVDPIYGGDRVGRKNLKADASQISNQKMRERTTAGQAASFNTAQIATIGTEPLRKRIVSMLPQTEDTALFDTKNPMSYEKLPNGNIRITQNKGYADTTKGGYFKQDASIEVSSEDAAFKELSRYTDLNDRQRGLDASVSKVKVKPTIPVRYLDNTNKTVLSRADAAIVNLSPTVQKAFIANPARFLTEKRTKETFKTALANTLPEEKINQLVTVMNTNLNKLTPEMKGFDGNWVLSVKTSTGKSIVEGDTGIKYLEDDWAYVMKSFPQIVVSDGVLRYVMENPEEVDSLINTLQQ